MWEDHPTQIQSQCLPIPGRDLESAGITPFHDLTKDDERVFEHYKHVISDKIHQEKDIKLPDDFEFTPSSVAKQIELPDNCYFHIDLPHSVVIVKIIPKHHVTDLSKHITLHREPFVARELSITELNL